MSRGGGSYDQIRSDQIRSPDKELAKTKLMIRRKDDLVTPQETELLGFKADELRASAIDTADRRGGAAEEDTCNLRTWRAVVRPDSPTWPLSLPPVR